MGKEYVFMDSIQLNYWAILAGAVSNMIIGSLWYSPMLLGNMWIQAMGWSPEVMEQKKRDTNMWKSYGGMFVGALVMAYVLAHFVWYMNVRTFGDAFALAFWLWLGFIATVNVGGVLFEGRPWKLFWINAGYNLVSLVVMAVILGLWK